MKIIFIISNQFFLKYCIIIKHKIKQYIYIYPSKIYIVKNNKNVLRITTSFAIIISAIFLTWIIWCFSNHIRFSTLLEKGESRREPKRLGIEKQVIPFDIPRDASVFRNRVDRSSSETRIQTILNEFSSGTWRESLPSPLVFQMLSFFLVKIPLSTVLAFF